MKDDGVIRRFCGDESGATAIEYGLIAAFIALAVALGLTQADVGGKLKGTFGSVGEKLDAAPK